MKRISQMRNDIEQLEQTHAKLDKQVHDGYSNYLDDPHLTKLKQEKLFIKNQIEQMKQGKY